MPLLTPDEAKEALNITSDAYNAELQDYIDGAIAAVENICGPAEPTVATDVIQPVNGTLILTRMPLVEVTSVIGATDGTEVVSTIRADLDAGMVTANFGESALSDNWYTVAYTYGRASAPAAMKQAAKVILKHQWQTQRAPSAKSAGDAKPTFAIPNAALQMLVPYARGPRVA